MLYFLALFSLSTSPNWAKLNQMPSDILGFWRLSIATLLILAYHVFRKKIKVLTLNRDAKWIFVSGVFFFFHLWTFKFAAKNTLVSNTMVLFATNPIWASMGSAVFFKERIHQRVYWAYAIALFGIIYLVRTSLKFTPEYNVGNTAALFSALFYALYMLTGKRARQIFSNQVFSTYQFLTCAILFFFVSVYFGHPFVEGYALVSWVSVAGLVLIPTFLGHFLLTHLVTKIDLAVLSCGKLIEPILASIMAYLIFHEELSSSFFISFGLTSAAVIILFWPQILRFMRGVRLA